MSAFCRRFGFNAYWSGKYWAKRKDDTDYWHALVRAELRRQKIPQKIFMVPVTITFYYNDGLDCSNHSAIAKMIEDAVKGHIIHDDARRYVTGISHRFHDQPYILVEVEADQ